ncbi:MAG: hypothetical protein F6K23_08125, partial [Okeania sp. SIO2C9]|uniref:SdrD B-like domain-containing protein n=1 Tax=Okeania sp. SIO2C9 TaxID=2607791 RepID=UPI0013BF382C
NDFVDEIPNGSISGTVTEDTDNNGTGDTPLADVEVVLRDDQGNNVATTTTGSDGTYSFNDVEPGDYEVVQTNLPGYQDVSDQDNSNDGDPTDNDTTVDNIVGVTLEPGEDDTDNDFVDEIPNGSISGTVTEDTDNNGTGDTPLADVEVVLRDDQGNNVATTTTGSDGTYSFNDVEPGDYEVVQTNLPGYQDVSDQDNSNDGDPTDNDTTVDNIVGVTLEPGEDDTDNDFVDELTDASIDIEKSTNGVDADAPEDAPEIPAGDTVTWTYKVTNTGNVSFTENEIQVTDDQEGTITNIIDQGNG